MRTTIAHTCLICMLVTATQQASADLYGYVDENGRAHVSTQPIDDRYKLFGRQPVANADKRAEAAAPRAKSRRPLPNFNKQKRKYASIVRVAATKYRLDPALIHAVIAAESGYNPSAVSPRGATGLMQLTADTAQRYGVADSYNPKQNVLAGCRYLHDLMRMFDNDLALVLAAYNAGHNTVLRYGRSIPPYPETRAYVPRVLQFYDHYRAAI